MEGESIKHKLLPEVTRTNRCRQLPTSLVRTILQFYNKQVKEKKTQISYTDLSEYSQGDYLFQELLETLRQKEKNLVGTQM